MREAVILATNSIFPERLCMIYSVLFAAYFEKDNCVSYFEMNGCNHLLKGNDDKYFVHNSSNDLNSKAISYIRSCMRTNLKIPMMCCHLILQFWPQLT
jgi:hypothetical protein